ncbi:MAG: hypothetical protein OXR66_01375 [Candidatus Woesearchaeota archaeon]|nr:hypothetical protein [Candidatus Woesearchaeota archaeon]
MILELVLYFIIAVGLSFVKVDVVPIASVIVGIHFGSFVGVLFGIITKIVNSILRKQFDHRTLVHIAGIIFLVKITASVGMTLTMGPLLGAILAYIIITFIVIQLFGGDFLKGLLFAARDIVVTIVFIKLLQLASII